MIVDTFGKEHCCVRWKCLLEANNVDETSRPKLNFEVEVLGVRTRQHTANYLVKTSIALMTELMVTWQMMDNSIQLGGKKTIARGLYSLHSACMLLS